VTVAQEAPRSMATPQVVPVNPPRQVRMQMESFDESEARGFVTFMADHELDSCMANPFDNCE